MRKSMMFTTFAAASLALSTSAVLVAQPTETPASDNAATPAEPAAPATAATPADPSTDTAAIPAEPATAATPATPAAKEDPLSPDAAAATETSMEKDKGTTKKAAKKPR